MANILPPVEFATITGRFMVAGNDSNDPGGEADIIPAKGKGTISPSVGHVLVAGSTPPATIKLATIDFEIDSEGYISDAKTKERDVQVVAPSEAVNPSAFTYKITFDGGLFPGFDFHVVPGSTIDLTDVGRVAASVGVAVTRGEPGVGIESMTLSPDRTSLVVTYEDGAEQTVEIPVLGEVVQHVNQVRTELDEAFDASAAGNVLPPRLTKAALDDTYERVRSGELPVAVDAELVDRPDYSPIEQYDGVMWGCKFHVGQLATSLDGGVTWTEVGTPCPATVRGFVPNSSGELVVNTTNAVYLTSGWASDPSTATWTKVTETSPGTATMNRHCFDGYGDKFIFTEYSSANRADSRWAKISVDGGATWTKVWDTDELFPDTAAGSHLHSVCYDRWSDRFYLNEGHDVQNGIYYSDDDGANWTRMTGGLAGTIDPSPTVMIATDDGIICGTDSDTYATVGIPRNPDGSVGEVMVPLHRWEDPRVGVIGFGARGWRDDATGLVYISYFSGDSGYRSGNPIVVVGTATEAARMWSAPESGSGSSVTQVFPFGSNRVRIQVRTSAASGSESRTYEATLATLHQKRNEWDHGNILGGDAGNKGSGVAVGPGANINSATSSIAIGSGARASIDSDIGLSVAVGSNAQAAIHGTGIGTDVVATGAGGVVALGRRATATGAQGTSIGFYSEATSSQSVAVGSNASASGSSSVAAGGNAISSGSGAITIGASALADANYGIAIGRSAKAQSVSAFAVGWKAEASGAESVSIGTNSVSTATYGISIGQAASTAGGTGAVALGAGSEATANYSTALGRGAKVSRVGGVALGWDSQVTHADQVAVGPRDVEVQSSSKGVVLWSPDGTRYRVTVANGGTLAVTAA